MNYKVIMAMLLLAVFAIGAVSATDDVAIDDNVISEDTDVDVAIDDVVVDEDSDDVAVEDQSSDDSDDNTRAITYTQFTVTTSSNFTDINNKISDGTYDGYQFNFESGTYNNFAMVTGNNNKFVGNGAILIGSTNHLFTISDSSNIIITDFVMQNGVNKSAIYGSNVENVKIMNNNISGGRDGINIFQTYESVTITGNRIINVTRDAISLVNHKNFTNSAWDAWSGSTIYNNYIYGGEYAMFLGGNFKGMISTNTISNSDCGMQFAGKKNATNGRLNVIISSNTITGVKTGIDMNHPCVIYLNIISNTISTADTSNNYTIAYNSFFAKAPNGNIYVSGNRLFGLIKQSFINQTDTFNNIYDGTIVNS